jgi:light-regulated signal transduction histidine kinase (bacteriophytochrome)
MNVKSLIVVGNDTEAGASAVSAARAAYPDAKVTQVGGVADAARRGWRPTGEILILLRPTPAEIHEAALVRDSRGLSRWPIVAFGDGPIYESVHVVAPRDWKSDLGAKTLEAAAELHKLRCEYERLRGDLRTLGRRFSHDLRTPLNCVSTASVAVGRMTPETEPSQATLAQTLLGAVAEVGSLIERVSFVLKATADPVPLHPIAMRAVVWSALQRLEVRTKRMGATIIQPDSWPQVLGVAAWLEVVWENLIWNGIVHGGPSPRIELGWVRDSSEFLFRVRDRGPGVPIDKQKGLFTPFNLLHSLDAPRGLGLPIVHRLVDLHGGRCYYENSLGGGACFFFALPA